MEYVGFNFLRLNEKTRWILIRSVFVSVPVIMIYFLVKYLIGREIKRIEKEEIVAIY